MESPMALILETVLKTDARTVICPYCKNVGFTRAEKKLSLKKKLKKKY